MGTDATVPTGASTVPEVALAASTAPEVVLAASACLAEEGDAEDPS